MWAALTDEEPSSFRPQAHAQLAPAACLAPGLPKAHMVSSALGDTPCLKLTGRSCPDISGFWGAAGGRVYILSETCLGCVWAEGPHVRFLL